MTARPKLTDAERDERAAIRLTITTLEARAKASSTVVISAQLARLVARHLKRLLEKK